MKRSLPKGFLIPVLAVFLVFSATPATFAAEEVGTTRSFRVNPEFDSDKRSNISATLRYTGRHAYFFIDDKFWNQLGSQSKKDEALDLIKFLSGEFDNTIYLKETAVWGSEPNPGIDGDPRVYILMESLAAGSGGYFETVNGFTKEQAPESNVHEMIVISAEVQDRNLVKNFLAHEFHHLISFQQKELSRRVSEETWLNELRAEYSPTLVGYSTPYAESGLERRVSAFIQNPTDSLTEWPNETADYAPASLLAHYMVSRYGTDILSSTLKSVLSGIASLDDFLSKRGGDKFANLFMDWLISSYINDSSVGSRYGYSQPELRSLRISPTYQSSLYGSSSLRVGYTVKGWQPLWHEIRLEPWLDDESAIKIFLNSSVGTKFPFALAVFYSDGTYRVHNASPVNGPLSFYITNQETGDIYSPKVSKILLALTHDPGALPGGTYPAVSLNGDVSIVSRIAAEEALAVPSQNVLSIGSGTVEEGALIKRNNSEQEMYVVTGKYKRYLRPEIIALYGHLDPSQVIPVPPSVFDAYPIANYVRVEGDKKVWVIWPDGTRHWLNISGEQFTASGRDWGAIFTINPLELAAYQVGIDITY